MLWETEVAFWSTPETRSRLTSVPLSPSPPLRPPRCHTYKGVSANSIGRYGDTPLHVAAATGNTDAARLLLTRGGNPLRKNLKGQTPYDVARLAAYDMNDVAGRELVECLEIAAAEAASAAAATAAAEAKLAAERGKDTFHGERRVRVAMTAQATRVI